MLTYVLPIVNVISGLGSNGSGSDSLKQKKIQLLPLKQTRISEPDQIRQGRIEVFGQRVVRFPKKKKYSAVFANPPEGF